MKTLSEIVADATFVTLLGAGECAKADLFAAIELAPTLVCADGGADTAFDLGLKPTAIVGDLDSLDLARATGADVPVIELADQNFSDFDKALMGLSRQFVLAVGFLGGRFDHQLTALTALSRAHGPVVLIGSEDVICSIPREIEINVPAGTRISLWPIVESSGHSTGLRWPIDGLTLSPQGRIGTSNAAEGPVKIEVTSGELLLILPRDCLTELVAALS